MVIIVADTLSCISPTEAAELGIPYLPQIIIFGEEQFRDDTEITSEEFLKKLVNSPQLPKTAAPSPALYEPVYRKALENKDTVLVICPSKDLSGTVRGAEVAAQDFPELEVHVFDTRTLAAALGTHVAEGYRLAHEGKEVNEIIHHLTDMIPRERTYFLVDTLEYLHRGGRIGGAKRLLGSLMQMKPILTIKNGQVEPFETQRTWKKALDRIKELVIQDYPRGNKGYLKIQHGGAEDIARDLAEELASLLDIEEVPVCLVPPAVLVHSGPGVVGVSFFVG